MGISLGGKEIAHLFPSEFEGGAIRFRRVSDDIYAFWMSRHPDYLHGSGIHILERNSDDMSTVSWHDDIDSLTVARYAAIKVVPPGFIKSQVQDNLDVMRAADLCQKYYGEEKETALSDLTDKFDLAEIPQPNSFDGPKDYHRVEEYFLDPRLVINFGTLQMSKFSINGWRGFRIGQSRDLHFLYLGFAELPQVVSRK